MIAPRLYPLGVLYLRLYPEPTEFEKNMDSIDLRSDTVSWPTPEMREAMASAKVGDADKEEDPTVNRLQEMAATLLGKEAAMLVTSGTQGNIAALLSQCQRGDEVIMGDANHIYVKETAALAGLGAVQAYTIPTQPDGTYDLNDVRQAVRTQNVHHPITRFIALENTHGSRGAVPLTPEYTRSIRAICDEYNIGLHIDGARIWNAATALNVDVKELVGPADSVTFCLSKGLCAPVGSLIVGSADLIQRAKRIRKMMGGSVRQGGVFAAAGIIALEMMTKRLHEDHANAKRLGEGLSQIEGIQLDYPVHTNMVFFSLSDDSLISPDALSDTLRQHYNIKVDHGYGSRNFRAVTHYWIKPQDIELTINAVKHTFAVTA